MINSFILQRNGEFKVNASSDELRQFLRDDKAVIWVDFEAASNEENGALTDIFNFHPLAVEDCINLSHHPKLDKYDDYLFLVLHAVDFGRKKGEEMATLELNIFIGSNFIVTYHRKPIRSVIATRDRCRQRPEKILGEGPDFLMHKIVDALVDNYLPTFSLIEHEIDHVEDEVFENSSEGLLETILTLKKDVMYLKKVVTQQRNTVYKLANTRLELIGKDSQMYFSDIYDQLYRFTDQIENFRDLLNNMVDMYLSMSSMKMNQIVKTLTVVMTILMPMTLVTGIYGMNFKFMPEINSPYGYYLTLAAMLLMAILLGYFMKRKRWF